ncbi:MAG: FixH family protein [Rhodobacteraceae bacterium]|nr:FixH family protein [Paracoccaceae bacterium]
MKPATRGKEITGRKVLLMFLGAFGIIILANLALVYSAIGSWPGLETRNAYVESLSFEERRSAQDELNWDAAVKYDNGDVVLTLSDGAGNPVSLKQLVVVVGLATNDHSDRTVEMSRSLSNYHGSTDLNPGNWQVRVAAFGFDGEEFRQRLPLIVRSQ